MIGAGVRYESQESDVLELDLHASRDGELIVFHDDTVDRITNGSGIVAEMTLPQLKKLDAGWYFTPDQGKSFPWRGKGLTIPTLREVFAEFQTSHIRINIEIKRSFPNIENKLYNLIASYYMIDRVLVASGYVCIRNRFRRVNKRKIAMGAHTVDSFCAYFLSRLNFDQCYQPKYDALQVPYYFRGKIKVVSKELVQMCHSKKVGLHVWSINDINTMRTLLDMGVDGIMTDYPDRLNQVFRKYGYR